MLRRGEPLLRTAIPCAVDHTTRCRDGDRLAHPPVPRRWAKEPDRRASIIRIEMPRRSIEHVDPPRRRSPRTARMTERTSAGGAADRECLVLPSRLRHAANNPNAHSSQMRSVLRLSDLCFRILSGGPTLQMSRALHRHHHRCHLARRLHLVVGPLPAVRTAAAVLFSRKLIRF